MGIKANFSKADLDRATGRILSRIDRDAMMRLAYLGEQCVNHARDLNTGVYTDQTGNLRSSIGYVIYHNGIRRSGYFPGEVAEGKGVGEQVAAEIAAKYTSGYVLAVVAGMDYALHVEAKGYNVLTASEYFAQAEAPKIIEKIMQRFK